MSVHAVVKSLKPFFPPSVWETYKRHYNRIKYAMLWHRRRVVSFKCRGVLIKLAIVNPNDVVQAEQAAGAFYEQSELDEIGPYFRYGGVFVDIGANTGQHSIYFARLLGASETICFEPIQETCRLLRENMRLNSLEKIVDLSNLGIGLSDTIGNANFTLHINNLGAASLHEDGSGPIPTTTGDRLLDDRRVDFIKIDTEGYEIKVLKGLRHTIAANRPPIYIEVDDENLEDFASLVAEFNYKIEKRHRRYKLNENFLLLPK
jgi:FkbM family methyltransferase